ncbi:MAG: thiaminase II [Pseudonocardiaceae bacterium]|nr:thiaminase II [Pseudonocardiaceae bacterium]
MAERLTDSLWSSIEDIYQSILAHPFITGLTDGSLPHDTFLHFIAQDAHYLRGFARALTVCAAKAPTENDTVMFAQHAAGAISAEQEMHAELAGQLGLSAEQLAARPIGPTTQAYGSYLLATTHGCSFPEGLAAVLPCYWIYARVGDSLVERSSPDPLYARWIAMYGGEDFQSTVDEVLALTDRIGGELSSAENERVRGHFVTTSRYEWMFWDAGYRQETWPI